LKRDLPFCPPYDWDRFRAFVQPRLIPSLETLEGTVLTRRLRDATVRAEYRPLEGLFRVQVDGVDVDHAIERARKFFDLRCDPEQVRSALASTLDIPAGLRVPGSWNPFEACVRAVLGQQVSVKAATTFAARLCDRFGGFPTAAEVAEGSIEGIGLTAKRTQTLRQMAVTVAEGSIRIDDPAGIRQLTSVPGIGPWTAEYIALRCGDPDAYPGGDLVLKRHGNADAWKPWRAYAAMAIWMSGGVK
jgi:AraC family transcriptional regulator, regulatory protein of adaptative response / DNA-3-methyladenine glycosylase II